MYKDAQFEYYDWNDRPIGVPIAGGPVQMYHGGKWQNPPGEPWPAAEFLKPGGDAATIADEKALDALMERCDKRDRVK